MRVLLRGPPRLMPARQGQTNPLAGPRLPGKPKIGPQILGPKPGEEPFSPTNGSCFNCGDRAGVMEFALVHHGRAAGHWRLCPPCWTWGNVPDPRATDPLTAT